MAFLRSSPASRQRELPVAGRRAARGKVRYVSPLLTIRSEQDYAAAIERLDSLLEEIGEVEHHPLYGLLDTLGTLIHAYEVKHVPIPEASGPEVLEYLMEEHGLRPEDLPEFSGLPAVLAHERNLHADEIRALAERFGVSPAVFF